MDPWKRRSPPGPPPLHPTHPTLTFTPPNPHTPIPCSPNEKLAAAGSADGSIFLWDLDLKSNVGRLRSPKLSAAAAACTWSPTGVPLATSDKAGTVTLWQ